MRQNICTRDAVRNIMSSNECRSKSGTKMSVSFGTHKSLEPVAFIIWVVLKRSFQILFTIRGISFADNNNFYRHHLSA